MSFTGTVNAGMAKFTKSMKNSADNCKLEGKIAEQQKLPFDKIKEKLKRKKED